MNDDDPRQIDHDPNEARPKYPRKVLFGLLTDYGPPKEFGLTEFLSVAILITGLYFAKNGWPF